MLFNKNLCTKRLSARFLSLFDVTILPNLLLFCDNHPVSQVAKMSTLLPYKAHILTRKKYFLLSAVFRLPKKEIMEISEVLEVILSKALLLRKNR